MKASSPDNVTDLRRNNEELTKELSQARGELAAARQREAATADINARLVEEVQARTNALTESLEQQTASAEILRVISQSTTEIQPVFDTIARNAARLCDAQFSNVFRYDGELLHLVAYHNFAPEILEVMQRLYPMRPSREQMSGRAILANAVVQVEDTLADPDYRRQVALVGRWRSILAVPMVREGKPVGVININRTQPGTFTRRQIELLQTFAAQAVIAIENARLFEEVQARTREVTEALEQQTATSKILSAISGSPGQLDPVFDTLLASARELCEAEFGHLLLFNGKTWSPAALHNLPQAYADFWNSAPVIAPPESLLRRILDTRQWYQIVDTQRGPAYKARHPLAIATVELGGARTLFGVPLLKEGRVIGAIVLYRKEVRPFQPKQIALLSSFADQAVIAIENARLFEEVQARTKDLEASLDRQTATGDVLAVISRSPSQTQPVFDVIVATAARLCRAEHAVIFKREGDGHYHVAAANNAEAEWLRFVTDNPILPGRGSLVGRTVIDGKVVHIPDCLADPEFTFHTYQRVGKFRTMLGVPLMHQGSPAGVIGLLRNAVEPFSDTEIDLVTTFADQAVIAIENARLLDELQSRSHELARSVEELRALGQVGQTVSSSLDLKVVLPRILEHACAMSETGGGAIYVFDKACGEFHLEAGHNMSEELIAAVREHPIRLGESVVGQCAERREAVQFEDLTKAPTHPLIEMHIKSGVRALLAVPLLHQDEVVGALVVRRRQPGAFPDPIVNLMQTFANQSAIAVHNARLFHEIEEKGRQLEIASQHKSQFVANMSHELRTPLAAMLGYAELLQEGIYGALPEKAPQVLARIQSNGKHLLGLINTVLDISKIESGQFKLNLSEYALSSMVETVRVATESLAAAKKLAFHVDVAKGLPHGLGDEQRLTQVLLNLVGNAIKFTDKGEVRVVAGLRDGAFAVTVSDTGPGIPAEERDKVFEKFHQIDNSSTRTKGGTGLGLAIAKDIVEMHGGRIWVESTLGKGATFHLELPVRAVAAEVAP